MLKESEKQHMLFMAFLIFGSVPVNSTNRSLSDNFHVVFQEFHNLFMNTL